MQVIQESDVLFRLTRFGLVNCFLVREEDGFTLVDTGLAGSGKQITKVAERIGGIIRRILLTHAHVDHAGSIDDLCRLLPSVELIVGERESRLLRGDFSMDT